MTKLANPLIQETDELLVSIKRNYIKIAANLLRIRNTMTDEEWVEYYESRDITRSAASKFLKVGGFVLAHNMTNEVVSHDSLYRSIVRNKDADPKLVLAEAKAWRSLDYKAQAKEDCKNHEYEMFCKHCWKHQ